MYIATNPSKKSQTALLCYLHTKERRADAKREAKPVFQPEVSLLIGMIKFFEKLNLNLFSIMSCNLALQVVIMMSYHETYVVCRNTRTDFCQGSPLVNM